MNTHQREVAAPRPRNAATSTNVPTHANSTSALEPFPEPLPAAQDAINHGRALGEIPPYGTPEWQTLPAKDWRRCAAVFIAAEAWRHDSRPDVIAARMAADLAERDREANYRLRESIRDVSAATDWHKQAERRTYSELEHRRNNYPATDYQGGPVSWRSGNE